MTSTRATLLDILAGILGAVLAAGIPCALWVFAGNPIPTTIPTIDTIVTALFTRDDGTLFFHTLTRIGWIAWAIFVISLVLPLPHTTTEGTPRP